MSDEIILQNKPRNNYLWKGLGGNFDTLTQIIGEFIDNSLSDFIKNPDNPVRQITISFEELPAAKYQVTVEDTGRGIADLDEAFSIGGTEAKLSSLNEHGFGMKHALAAANPDNASWRIMTRTPSDEKAGVYSLIKAPFQMEGQQVQRIQGMWPGTIQTTGTIIEFAVDKHWLSTITRGLKGSYSRLDSIATILNEDIGFTYGPLISKAVGSIQIRTKSLNDPVYKTMNVSEVKPVSTKTFPPGRGSTKYDLGKGEVTLNYEFLEAERSDYKRYYLANISTSGVEVRINGRAFETGLFSEIWPVEKHNSYNSLLIRIDIESDDPERLPATTTTKAGIRRDDAKFEALLGWIKQKMSTPKREAKNSKEELDLFEQLRNLKYSQLRQFDPSMIIDNEKYAFETLDERIRIDLFQSFLNQITIYEGKIDKSTPLDVYQLQMYWDGLVLDGMKVEKAILIASEHPKSVKTLAELKNEYEDQNGDKYVIELRTWRDEGISYP